MKSKYNEYRFSVKKNETEWMQEEGFIEVELSEDMMDDLMINEGFREEIVNGTKKVLGRLWNYLSVILLTYYNFSAF